MSWITFLTFTLFTVFVGVLGTGVWRAFRGHYHARWERLFRSLGALCLIGALAEVAVWFDWASDYPLAQRFGRTVWGAPQSTSNKLMYTFFGLFGFSAVCLGIAALKKRRRIHRATDDFLKTKVALVAEYGEEEAERIAERTGLEQRWNEEFHNDF